MVCTLKNFAPLAREFAGAIGTPRTAAASELAKRAGRIDSVERRKDSGARHGATTNHGNRIAARLRAGRSTSRIARGARGLGIQRLERRGLSCTAPARISRSDVPRAILRHHRNQYLLLPASAR